MIFTALFACCSKHYGDYFFYGGVPAIESCQSMSQEVPRLNYFDGKITGANDTLLVEIADLPMVKQ